MGNITIQPCELTLTCDSIRIDEQVVKFKPQLSDEEFQELKIAILLKRQNNDNIKNISTYINDWIFSRIIRNSFNE